MKTNSLNAIKNFAINAHQSVNHLYDGQPYSVHLQPVVEVFQKFKYLIPIEDHEDIESALWLHDTIEDCRLTYNDIVKISNIRVANIVYALSNEKGKTRIDRANKKYYDEMIIVEYARFCKLCDRLANIQYSKSKKSRMFDVYRKENKQFFSKLFFEISLMTYHIESSTLLLNKFVLAALRYLFVFSKYYSNKLNIKEYEKHVLTNIEYELIS